MSRRKLLLETIEDRILCDAAPQVDPATVKDPKVAEAASVAVKVEGPQPLNAAANPPAGAQAPTLDAASSQAGTNTTNTNSTTDAPSTGLTDEQRAALEAVVRDSTNQIWFQPNVGQFADGVRYGFKTQFGSMLVYDDHLSIVSNQVDPTTGAVGVHTVNVTFDGSQAWQIVPGGQSGVLGTYQNADGTSFSPQIFKEVTLRNVYSGVDLRLYSADQGVLEFDWLVARAQDYQKIRLNFTGQDGLNFGADGSATLDLRFQDLTLKMPEVYQIIDGQKQLIDSAMVAGDAPGQMKYALSGNIVADQPLVIDPNVAWATYFDLNDTSAGNAFDSYLFAIQVNSSGVYCAGWVKEIITNGSYSNYMQVNAGFAQGTATNQNYIYRLNTAGTAITAWTSTGIVGSSNSSTSTNPATDLKLFPDGRVVLAYRNATVQVYSADLSARPYSGTPTTLTTINSLAVVSNSSFYAAGIIGAANTTLIPAGSGLDDTFAGGSEAVIIRYTLNGASTPVADWATYVGGAGAEDFVAIAMTPDMTKLVFSVHSVEAGTTLAADAYPTLVNPVDSTPDTVVGRTELLTGVIADQATKPSAFSVFSLLGGSGNEGLNADSAAGTVVVATNTGYWVAGNTASTDLPSTAGGAQTTNGTGTNDAFISYIPINGGTTGFRSTYLGGSGNELVGGIAYDPVRDRVLVFGTTSGSFPTVDTTPTSIYYQSAAGGGLDIFIATFDGALTTKDYATYIGGTGNDYLGDTGLLLGTGHVTYSTATDQVYLATTVHSTLDTSVIGPLIPGYDKTKSNSTNDVHVIFAFNISIFDHGDAPASYEGGTPAADAISLKIRLGSTVDAETAAQSGATATGDDVFNTGAADDEDGVASLSTFYIDASTYSVNVAVTNTTGAAQTLQGWIDFNKDGIFQASERATASVANNATTATLTWSGLPSTMTAGQSYLRIRFTENVFTDNLATDIDERSFGVNNVATGHGEIEDYALTFVGATVAGTVYRDTNNNGTLTGGEPGISGVTLTLTGKDDLGNNVSVTTTTAADGTYSFTGLRKSDASGYIITETQPGGFIDGVETAGTLGGTVSNVFGTDTISAIVVPSTATNATGYNFGELLTSSLSGNVYQDNNNNGAIDGGENGIGSVTVTLTGTDAFGQAVSRTTTTTAGTGAYSFDNVRPGTYTITETPPGGFLDGKETVGTQASGTVNNSIDSDTISGIALGQNVTGSGNLFGELVASSLGGRVYGDLNGNGLIDAFESGIPGATVTLTGTDDRGAAVNLVQTTNASGLYSFSSLRPGSYTLTETQPSGYSDGIDTQGTPGGGTAINDAFQAIPLASNTTGAGNNFGESPNFGLTKSLQTTNVAGTSGGNLSIGETATFRLVLTIPAGSFGNFQVQDALPAGFQYLNGSAVVALVSSAGQLTSSTLSGAGLAQTTVGTPTFTMPDTAVSNNSTTNVDTYTSGTDVYFKLGNLTNTDTNGATTESVVIEFQAVVVNEVANQAGSTLPNTFSVLLDKDGAGAPDPHGPNSNTVTSTVVEAVLGVTKTLVTSGADAGDAVSYTITITNAAANNAAAYDIRVADLLNTGILLNNTTLGSGIVVSGATVLTNSSTTANLDLVLDTLAAGASATITINGTVASTATAGSTITNGTTITWTSTPGANTSERDGSGGINDYTASATSGTFTLSRPTVDKLTPSDTTYSIGETITYDILVTLPEGVTSGLQITDNLPAGLSLVSAAVQTAAGGTLTNAFAGSVPSFTTSNVGNSYTFTFGATTTTGDNNTGNNSFLVRVTAQVANVIGNQNAVVLTNTATLTYNDGTLGSRTVNDPTPNVNITVVEPVLTLDKIVVGTATGLDAGDAVQYQITITNTGTATAHEVLLSDALPVGLLVSTINSTVVAAGATVDTTTAGTGTATLNGEYTIPVGGSVTILYTATLQSTVLPNTNYTNTATVTFSSVDGTVTGERVGTAPNTQGDGSLDDYRLQDTAQISTGGVLTISKGVNNATPSIGDILTYTVTLTLNEGTTNGIVVTDTLPASGDLSYVAGSAAVSFGTAGSTVSGSATPVITGAGNNILTFTLGTAVVPAGAGANTVILTYQVLVRNVITNQAGDTEGNSAHVVATNLTTPPDSTTTVTLKEPNVTFTKNVDKTTNVDAGDVLTYTVVLTNPGGVNGATAYDALLTDTLPADLRVTGITSTTLAGGATTDTAANITGGGTGLNGQYDIPIGGTVTIVYTAVVQDSFTPNGTVTNNATLTWTSKNGGNSNSPDPNERFGSSTSLFGDGSLNDYRRTTSSSSTGYSPTFSKTLFSTSDTTTSGSNVTIGEQVTYALLVTLPEGTTNGLNIVDALPAGLRFVSATVATTTSATNPLSANFGGTVPAPTVTGGAADGDDVNFAFGAITATGDNNTGNNTFAIMVTAVVTDVPANSGVTPQTILGNTATLTGTGIPPTTPPPVNVTVSEPRLQITKGVDDPTADLGQTLTFTLTIAHTASSTATAYDLIIRDSMPAGFTLNPASIAIVGGAIATNTSTTSQLGLTIDQLTVGGTITITYTATVGTGAALGGTNQDNNARLYWDTTASDTGTNTVLNGGSDGDDDRDFGATPAYVEAPTPVVDDPAQDSVRVTVNTNTLSGTIYRDADSSGTLNGTEAGLGVGVSVTISGTTFFGAAFTQTVTADPVTGAYTFVNVPRSDATGYTITETPPVGFVDGLETVGSLFGGTKSDALNSDTIANVVVPAGSATATGYNFGELLGSSISGATYLDLNNDGVKLVGETGLGTGLPVTISGTDVFGQAVSITATSDPTTGAYTFTGLRPSGAGGYTVAENDASVVASSFFDGKDTAGSLGGTVTGTSPKFDAINVNVAQNQTGTGYNFGEISKSSFSGNVYADLNNNGTFDAFERGIPGVTVTLTGVDDQGTVVNLSVNTDSNGAYAFLNLRPSNGTGYTITETQPPDYLDGSDTIGTPGGTVANDVFSAVILTAGTNGANNNFGEAPNFALTKTLVSTSESGTTGSNVAIGELAKFRLVVTIPAGQLSDFQVQDFLPAGYAYVDGSARAGLVGAVTSTTISATLPNASATPVALMGDATVSSSPTANVDTYSSGTDVYFKFGNLAATDTGAAIVIEFDAQVVNEATNVAGTTLTNSFGVLYDRNGVPGPEPDPNPPTTPPSVNTGVVTPVLTLTKTATPVGVVSAGDSVTYTLTISNPGTGTNSTAFDALVRDTMPADILISAITGTTLTGGATADSGAIITGGGTGLSGQYDIPVGGTVTITYTGLVQVTAAPGATEINNAELTWTSINGNNSLTPDTSERYGAPGTLFGDGNLNNLRRVASHTVTIGTAAFDKDFFSMSDPTTPGTDVGIGETVTYALIVTLPAGTTPGLSAIDTLPTGLQYLSYSIVTSAAASNGLLTQDFGGTVPTPTVAGGAADGDDVTFTFGSIVTSADSNPANNTFLILVSTRVTDSAGNVGLNPPGQTSLSNTATFDIPGDGLPPSTTPPVTVNVVEAKLTIDKSFNVTSADAGDTVLVSIVVGNTGTGPAHDVSLTDLVDLLKFGNITEVTTPAGFSFNNTAGNVTFSGGSIGAGSSATFVFSVKLSDGVNPSEVLSNTATVTATSQPGTVVGERNFGPVSDTATLPVPAVFNLTKGIVSSGGGKVSIGDVVTYSVNVTLVEGTTQNIVLTDLLPIGMSYVPGSAIVSNANGMTINGFAASIVGQVLTLSASNVVNPGSVDNTATTDSSSFTITYQTVVNDVAGNVAGTLLANNLTGGGTGTPPSTPPPVTTTVSEPSLKVTKAADDATPDLGQSVHFTLTIQNLGGVNGATAYDILVRDVLPAGLTGLAGITVNGATIDTNNSTGTVLDLKLDQLGIGATATVEFDAVVSSAAVFAGASIENNARIYWDSQAGESPNSVFTGVPDGDDDRDYGATGPNEVFNQDTDPAQDTERLTVNAGTLSGFVYADADASGALSAGDTGLAGQTVTLTGVTVFGENITLTATTGPTGSYSFGNLAPGTYTLTETQPNGYLDGAETAGTPFGGTVSNALGSNTISLLVIPIGNTSGTNYNFGEVLASSLSGAVYSDTNNDGLIQGTETGVGTVAIQITGTDFLGQAVSITTSTAVDGSYSFSGLRPGTYTITETQPLTYLDGKETVGAQASGLVDNTQDSNSISTISLAQGVSGTDNNFGELAPGSISGIVFDDLNNNGTQDPGESGLSGVAVTLTGTDDRGNSITIPGTTQADGSFSFATLRPGTYALTESQPLGYLDGKDSAGTLGGTTATNDQIGSITLAAGQNGTDNRFAELTPSSLSGVVFRDLNNDGTQGPGELGIGGASITLTGTDDLGNSVTVPITTAPDGTYSFANLRPGTYTISETQPVGFLDGKDSAGTLGGSIAVNDVISGITVAPAQSGTGNTFGELPGITLSGKVYIDSNNDGIVDLTEVGQSGVTVTLTGTDDLGNPVSVTTTTAPDGSYTFAGLRPSDANGYTITETQPAGLLDGKNTAGTLGGTTTNNPLSDVISGVVVATAGTSGTDYNFGELRPSVLGGLVFDDRNNNGVQDPGELGLSGVTVVLTGTDDLGNSVSTTLTSQPDGTYSFTGLRPGTYSIAETTPLGYLDGKDSVGTQGGTLTNDLVSNIVISEGTTGSGNNFAELTPASLSGTVFIDANNNGTMENGETGLGGQTVTLTGTDDLGNSVSVTITTQPDGTYSFANLRPGTYTVTETQPNGLLDGKDALGSLGGTLGNDNVSTITVNTADAGTNYTFGELRPSVLSGSVFDDRNNNGVQDPGELGLSGVTIVLSGTDDLGNPVSTTLTTQPDGTYSFSGLRPGTYSIAETTPLGYLDGKDTLGTQGGTLTNDLVSGIVISEGTTGTDNNFAELTPASLSGTVFIDANNNGAFDSGEAGLGGQTVTLTGTDDLGNSVSVTLTTQPDGTYSFTNVRPGTYTVTETQPNGLLDGKDAFGSLGGTLGNDNVSSITVNAADAGTGYTFGELRPSVLSGLVFDDRNNNGVQDSGELGLSGVTLLLTGTDDLGNPVSTTLTTQPDGSYSFTGLRPGTYSIAETTPTGYLDGKDTLGTQGGMLTNDLISNITISEGTTGTGNNFAELTPATLSGNVFIDANNNGVRDLGETGLATSVTLTGTDDLGASVNVTIQTNPDGTYSFGDLRPGSYTVTEAQPNGLLDGKDSAGSLGGTVGADTISAITVAAGDAGTNYNFGELRPASLSGFVFQDDSNDGIQQGTESGLQGVTVTLTGTDDLGQSVSITQTTGIDGSYSFDSLRPGSYTITETTPNGLLDGKDTLGNAGGTLTNDVAANITITEGQSGTGYTFGELAPSSFAGRVYTDLNNNGVIDPGETGVNGVTVTLTGTNDLGQPVSLTTTTTGTGDYSFGNLRPGTYSVTESQPAGLLDGMNTVGTGAGGTTVNNPLSDVISNITLGSNTPASGYNFGELPPATLSGSVFNDRNGNGLLDANDKPLAGVTITLTGTDDLGRPVSTTIVSGTDGSYSFANLRPGTYSISETQPGGLVDGPDYLGTAGGQLGNDVISQIVVTPGVTGTDYLFSERSPNVPTTPDLYVLKTDNLTTVRPGSRVTYIITGGNAGDATASGVIITDVLPVGLRFISASNGGMLSGGKVVWNIGDVPAGGTFRVTVTVMVENQVGGVDVVNTVTVKDKFGSPKDPTPKNNRAQDHTFVAPFAFDSFNNFSKDESPAQPPAGVLPPERSIDVWRGPIITPAPVYSGAANPGSTLVVELYNANGDRIGESTTVVDSGGNWLVSFPNSVMRDYPASVRISQQAAPYTEASAAGRNLRNFFVPAIQAGHFTFGGGLETVIDARVKAPLLGGLEVGEPFALGESVKYNVELLPNTGVPSGR